MPGPRWSRNVRQRTRPISGTSINHSADGGVAPASRRRHFGEQPLDDGCADRRLAFERAELAVDAHQGSGVGDNVDGCRAAIRREPQQPLQVGGNRRAAVAALGLRLAGQRQHHRRGARRCRLPRRASRSEHPPRQRIWTTGIASRAGAVSPVVPRVGNIGAFESDVFGHRPHTFRAGDAVF